MRRAAACAALTIMFAATGCEIGPTAVSLPAAPPHTLCLPLRNWSAADQDELRREYDALAPGAKLRLAFEDYIAMRDETRACLANSAPTIFRERSR